MCFVSVLLLFWWSRVVCAFVWVFLSPWYNCSGCLDVKHQVTYLLECCCFLMKRCVLSFCLSIIVFWWRRIWELLFSDDVVFDFFGFLKKASLSVVVFWWSGVWVLFSDEVVFECCFQMKSCSSVVVVWWSGVGVLLFSDEVVCCCSVRLRLYRKTGWRLPVMHQL